MPSPDLAAEPRIAAWDQRVDWWLTGLAAVFLAGYAWQVLDTSLTPAGRDALEVVLTVTWVLFGVDYLVRIALARRRWRFVRTAPARPGDPGCCRCSGSCGRCG